MQITGSQNQKQVTTKSTKNTKVVEAKSKAGHHEGHEEHEGGRGKIESEKPGTKDTQMARSFGRVDKRQRIHLSDLNGGCAGAYPPCERTRSNGICGFFDLPFVSFVPFVVIRF